MNQAVYPEIVFNRGILGKEWFDVLSRGILLISTGTQYGCPCTVLPKDSSSSAANKTFLY